MSCDNFLSAYDIVRSRLPLLGSSGIGRIFNKVRTAPDSLLSPGCCAGNRNGTQDIVFSRMGQLPNELFLALLNTRRNGSVAGLISRFGIYQLDSRATTTTSLRAPQMNR
jgi:hypothetical protein